jgi:hypothetical protein
MEASRNRFRGNRELGPSFSPSMTERIDFWRGFVGGVVAGVAIGALIYFSPNAREDRDMASYNDFDVDETDEFFLRRDAAESAGDPSRLIHETAGATRIDFERPGPRPA